MTLKEHLADALAAAPPPPSGAPSRETVLALILESVWSPASGPVMWDPETIARAKAQGEALTDCLLRLFAGGAQ